MTILTILTNKWVRRATLAIVFIVIGLLAGRSTNAPTITQTGTTTTISVPKITEKVIHEYVKDPAQETEIAKLLAENRQLKLQVVSLTSSVAHNKTDGGVGVNGGTITMLPQTTLVNNQVVTNPQEEPSTFEFNDFQLKAQYSSKPSFSYTLSQDFIITTTTGRNRDGLNVSQVKLGQRVGGEVKDIPVNTIQLTEQPQVRWWKSLRIQGGLALSESGTKSGIVGLQWLRRGIGPAAEDSHLSLLTVGLTIGSDGPKLVIAPLNYNLGGIKHSPFTNVWVGPTIDLNKSLGLAITATF